MGGAKIKDKILVLENLIDQADRIMCIGGMAYTFLKVSQGMAIGSSLFDKKGAEMVPRLIEKAKAKGCELVFPCDWLCGEEFKNEQPNGTTLTRTPTRTPTLTSAPGALKRSRREQPHRPQPSTPPSMSSEKPACACGGGGSRPDTWLGLGLVLGLVLGLGLGLGLAWGEGEGEGCGCACC